MIDITGLREDKRPQSATIVHALLDRLEAAESDAAHQKALAESALRVAEGRERKCGELRALVATLRSEISGLHAKIEAMERQEPVRHEFQGRDGVWYPFIDQRHHENTVADGSWPIRALYALPGAQPAPSLASRDVSLISEGKAQPAQSVKDAIIDDLQSQFDTEGITEHDSGDALIRLSDAIAAVEDNFAQPAPSVQDVPAKSLKPVIDWLRNGCDPMKAADELELLIAAAPEAKP